MSNHAFLRSLSERDLPEYWGWMFCPIGGGDMERVNLPTFYVYGRILSEAKIVDARDKIGDPTVLRLLLAASIWTQFFLGATNDISLPSTRDAAQNIHSIIKEHTSRLKPHVDEPDYNEELGEVFVKRLKEEIEAFELLFGRESRRINVFTVTPIGILDIEKLIESAEKRFPDNLLAVMPQITIDDLREAGKCLAFNLATACAFHVCRATEALMLTYYEALTNQSWSYPKRDWKMYNDQLAANGAPKAITNRLGEIREDRNAYAHPDITVPVDEAPVVFELCNGVIHLMAKEIEKLRAARAATP